MPARIYRSLHLSLHLFQVHISQQPSLPQNILKHRILLPSSFFPLISLHFFTLHSYIPLLFSKHSLQLPSPLTSICILSKVKLHSACRTGFCPPAASEQRGVGMGPYCSRKANTQLFLLGKGKATIWSMSKACTGNISFWCLCFLHHKMLSHILFNVFLGFKLHCI